MIESGKINEIAVYYLLAHNTEVHIGDGFISGETLQTLFNKYGIIIWENQGQFVLIPPAIIGNAWKCWNATQIIRENYSRAEVPAVEITWKQGHRIDRQVAMFLLTASKEYDRLSNTNSASDPPSEDQADKP